MAFKGYIVKNYAEVWLAKELDCAFVKVEQSVIVLHDYQINLTGYDGKDVKMTVSVGDRATVKDIANLIKQQLQENRP